MNRSQIAFAVLSMFGASIVPGARPATAAPADTAQSGNQSTFIGHHYEGPIDAIDTANGLVTITTRYGMKQLTIKVTPDTKIWKTVASTPDQLTVGAKIIAIGREGADKDSMQISAVDILPDFPPKVVLNPPKDHRNMLYGTVSTLTPTITVTDLSGAVVTLQTNNGRFATGATIPGDFTDFEMSVPIKADGDIAGGVLVANTVTISPGEIARRGGKGKNRPARRNPPAAPAPTPVPAPSAPAPAAPTPAPTPPAAKTAPAASVQPAPNSAALSLADYSPATAPVTFTVFGQEPAEYLLIPGHARPYRARSPRQAYRAAGQAAAAQQSEDSNIGLSCVNRPQEGSFGSSNASSSGAVPAGYTF